MGCAVAGAARALMVPGCLMALGDRVRVAPYGHRSWGDVKRALADLLLVEREAESMDTEIEEGDAEKRASSKGSTEQGGLPANAPLRYDGSGCALGNPTLSLSRRAPGAIIGRP